jgi:hypothetical protein
VVGVPHFIFYFLFFDRQEKERKKKKEWLLALTATKDVPVYAKLYLLKQTVEKVRGGALLGSTMKKVRSGSWPLYAKLYHLIKQTVEKVREVVLLGPLRRR